MTDTSLKTLLYIAKRPSPLGDENLAVSLLPTAQGVKPHVSTATTFVCDYYRVMGLGCQAWGVRAASCSMVTLMMAANGKDYGQGVKIERLPENLPPYPPTKGYVNAG